MAFFELRLQDQTVDEVGVNGLNPKHQTLMVIGLAGVQPYGYWACWGSALFFFGSWFSGLIIVKIVEAMLFDSLNFASTAFAFIHSITSSFLASGLRLGQKNCAIAACCISSHLVE